MNKKKYKKGKRKIRFDRILIFLLIICILVWTTVLLFSIKISNIFVSNNNFLSDQYIIEKAKIDNYPSTVKNPAFVIKNTLEKDIYIKDVKVYKKGFTKVYIEVTENRPLFFYDYTGKTILEDGNSVDDKYQVATVINYITDNYYDEFVRQMATLSDDVLYMISEIKYDPTDSDDNRFLLTMRDGNYVYVNLFSYKYNKNDKSAFEMLNMYFTLRKDMPSENGILYLDYGNNFEPLK